MQATPAITWTASSSTETSALVVAVFMYSGAPCSPSVSAPAYAPGRRVPRSSQDSLRARCLTAPADGKVRVVLFATPGARPFHQRSIRLLSLVLLKVFPNQHLSLLQAVRWNPHLDREYRGRQVSVADRRCTSDGHGDRKSTRLNSSHSQISYAV